MNSKPSEAIADAWIIAEWREALDRSGCTGIFNPNLHEGHIPVKLVPLSQYAEIVEVLKDFKALVEDIHAGGYSDVYRLTIRAFLDPIATLLESLGGRDNE